MGKINRLDPVYLKEWQKNYRELSASFVAGHISLFEAIDCLRHLGFKQDALKIEVLELQRAKREASGPGAPGISQSSASLALAEMLKA